MHDDLDAFAQRSEHGDADSTVVVVMSHGKGGLLSEGTLVQTKDGQFLGTEQIIAKFNNQSCPKLQFKPRMFIFQICRY